MKTTKKHFEYFKERCEHWISVLGLAGWIVYYYHEGDQRPVFAKVQIDYDGRVASITLNKNWDNIKLPAGFDYSEHLNNSALHECLEFFLAPMKDRYCSQDVEDERTHAVIRTLEKVLIPKEED